MKIQSSLARAISTGFMAIVLAACKHPIEIIGEGDVFSATGNRHCLLEDFQAQLPNCTENEVLDPYLETYTALPRAGYQFRRWEKYCKKSLTNECHFNIPQSLVDFGAGITLSPLQAVFRPTVNTGFTSLLIGNEFFEPLALGLEAHAISAGFPDHTSSVFFAPGDQGAPQAFWETEAQRTAIKAVLDTGTVELFGMTYSDTYPTDEGYRKWMTYALNQNPDTRFFITLPWGADAGSVTSGQYQADQSARAAVIHALVDALRLRYPGVDIYSIPDGQSAVELYSLFDAGSLPDVTGLVGLAADSVFSDTAGNPGDILTTLGQLVWLGAIYDIDFPSYSFNPGYPTDLKALAQTIVNDHDENYHAPDEVDVDTDGDGIWDRLDPNPTGKPNILLVMVDDLGFNDLSINNSNPNIDTPSMDQLAQDGVRFTQHYAHSVCSPARAALLTGLYAERVGYRPNGRGIPMDVVTLPEKLQEEGYLTYHIGKWHIGDIQRTAWPDYQGFDHWFGFLSQFRLKGTMSGGEVQLDKPTYYNPFLESDTAPGQFYPGHLEDILTDKAIAVISDMQATQAPWFLNLWFYAPHGPVEPSAAFALLYPDTELGRFQALVNQLDTNVGRLMTHLDTIGAAQDTIVLLVSDNGGIDTYNDNNTPYFGRKATVTEGALRTPLIIKWPDAALNNQVISDSISIHDIYPTIMDAIDATPPANLDGVSYYDSIAQTGPLPTPQTLFWELGQSSYGVLTADRNWRLYQPLPIWTVTLDPIIYDLFLDPTSFTEEVPTPPIELASMNASYATWFEDVHTVQTQYAPTPNGGGVLTGMGFMRTPGFFEYTFGVGVPDELDGQIVDQTGVWNMSRSGNTITAQLGSVILSGDIVTADACHNVVVTGSFIRRLSTIAPDPSIELTLYIDEVEAQSVDMLGELLVIDPTVPTIIGDPAISSGNGTIAPPVIMNSLLDDTTTLTLDTFSQSLCGP